MSRDFHLPVRRSIPPLCLTLAMAAGSASALARGPDPLPIWVDVDPACLVETVADVDDCWALLLALDAPGLRVVGVSSSFGNVDLPTAHRSATRFLRLWSTARGRPAPPLHRGARGPGDRGALPAVRAMAAALGREPLTLLALGPLTNLAQLFERHPAAAARLRRVVAVMGRRPGEVFLTGGPALHVHDLNLIKDPAAVAEILNSGLPLTLTPFSAGRRVVLDDRSLEALSRRPGLVGDLARASAGWARVWRRWLGGGGIPLFDAAAVAALLAPRHLDCTAARGLLVRRRALFSAGRFYLHILPAGAGRGHPVRYCARAHPMLQDWVMQRLDPTPAGPRR